MVMNDETKSKLKAAFRHVECGGWFDVFGGEINIDAEFTEAQFKQFINECHKILNKETT